MADVVRLLRRSSYVSEHPCCRTSLARSYRQSRGVPPWPSEVDRCSGLCVPRVFLCARQVGLDSGGRAGWPPLGIAVAERYRVTSLID